MLWDPGPPSVSEQREVQHRGWGPAAPRAAPSEPGVGSWLHAAQGFASPHHSLPSKPPHGADQLAPDLGGAPRALQAPEKGPQSPAGEAIGVNLCSELELQNSLTED